jgi:hypothetical protein
MVFIYICYITITEKTKKKQTALKLHRANQICFVYAHIHFDI